MQRAQRKGRFRGTVQKKMKKKSGKIYSERRIEGKRRGGRGKNCWKNTGKEEVVQGVGVNEKEEEEVYIHSIM